MKQKQNGISRKIFLERAALCALPLVLSPQRLLKTNGPVPQMIPLSTGWRFMSQAGAIASQKELAVTIPHCVSKLSWQDWNPASWQQLWHYEKRFDLPAELLNQRLFLHFDGVMVGARVTINGQELPAHYGGYLPFEYEITPYVKKENALEVIVDARWSNVPPEGSSKGTARVDYLEAGGIYRAVFLKIVPKVFIQDVFAKPVDVLNAGRHVWVNCTLNTSAAPVKNAALEINLVRGDTLLATTRAAVALDKTGSKEVAVTLGDLKNIRLWDINDPNLYTVVVKLYVDNSVVHQVIQRTGFREAVFTTDGFFLNGNRLQLFGLNRHEIFPYVGGAMPGRVMKNDALILKNKFNCNMVRCSHYPQSAAFLDACDELGLLVWEEVPGWGYLGDEQWKELLVQNTRDMVLRDRNHPSIIIWGVRVNESPNDPVLYRRTTEIAKKLDGSRPTSGSMTPDSMRTWKEDWHQDVLAFDDYHAEADGTVGIREPEAGVPYMLAEAVGQFNYAKRKNFDSYYRRSGNIATLQHQAVWHAQAHHKAALNKHNCGVIAWCAFEYASLVNDYRTVKYPGVADFFRIPKLGASFYMAQTDPGRRPVIEPDFYWDFGAETPRGPGKNVAIFSNCDRLELFVNNKLHSMLQPDIKNYYNLKYPPFFADLDGEGAGLPELRIDGYFKGKRLLSRSFSADRQKDRFHMIADDPELTGDGVDATRVEFGVTDAYGNYWVHGKGMVHFELSGPGQLLGDDPFNLTESGGVAAVWVKTLPGSSGKIVLTALHSELGKQKVEITVQRANAASVLI
ncbi:MAG: glycoside hydrolase family 2 protein [Niabella sp.]|nr:glycoside hydrolase family 2 protein [Niabella sp.]